MSIESKAEFFDQFDEHHGIACRFARFNLPIYNFNESAVEASPCEIRFGTFLATLGKKAS